MAPRSVAYCKSGRWFCFAGCKSCAFHNKYLTFRKLRKLLVFQLITGILFILILPASFINLSPPCTFYNTSACSESFSCCSSFHAYQLIYSRRIQHAQETAYYHIVNLPFLVGHMIQLYKLLCRNDGMMVIDLFIIHETCICMDWFSKPHRQVFVLGQFPQAYRLSLMVETTSLPI